MVAQVGSTSCKATMTRNSDKDQRKDNAGADEAKSQEILTSGVLGDNIMINCGAEAALAI